MDDKITIVGTNIAEKETMIWNIADEQWKPAVCRFSLLFFRINSGIEFLIRYFLGSVPRRLKKRKDVYS